MTTATLMIALVSSFLFCFTISPAAIASEGSPVLNPNSCQRLLQQIEDLPAGWGFEPGALEKMAVKIPEFRARLQVLGHLVHTVSDADNTALFEFLGQVHDLEVTQEDMNEMLAPFKATDEGRERIAAFQSLTGLDILNVSGDSSTNQLSLLFFSTDPLIHAALERLGPNLKTINSFLSRGKAQKHTSPAARSLKDLPGGKEEGPLFLQAAQLERKIHHYFKRRNDDPPSLRSLVEQFRSTQEILCRGFGTFFHAPISERCGLLREHLLHPDVLQEQKQKRAVLQEFFKDSQSLSPESAFIAEIDRVLDPNTLRNASKRSDRSDFRLGFLAIALRTAWTVAQHKAAEVLGREKKWLGPASELGWMLDFLQKDTFIDHGLGRLFHSLCVEIFFGKKVISGAEVTANLRQNIKKELWDLRQLAKNPVATAPNGTRSLPTWSSFPEIVSSPLELPRLTPQSRAERMAAYVSAKAQLPSLPPQRSPTRDSDAEEVAPPVTVKKVEEGLFALVSDRTLDLDTARLSLQELVQPNEILSVTMKRTGYTYRFCFSSQVLAEFIAPRKGQPLDFRDWFEAIAWGPARSRGVSGWKHLKGATLDWEIKILQTPYRLRGHRDRSGVWHFRELSNEK